MSEKIEECSRSKKIKTMTNFDQNECNSMKSIVIKKNLEVDVTTRFIIGENVTEEIREVYDRHSIIKCQLLFKT